MVILQTIPYSFDPESYEQQIRESVDDLGRVDSCIVILC